MSPEQVAAAERSLRRLLRLSLAVQLLDGEPGLDRQAFEGRLGEAAAQAVDLVCGLAEVSGLSADESVRRFDESIGAQFADPQVRAELVAMVGEVLAGGRRDDSESLAAAALVIGVAVLAAAGAAPLGALIAGAPVLAATIEAVVSALVAAVVIELFRRIQKRRKPPTSVSTTDGSAPPLDSIGVSSGTAPVPVEPPDGHRRGPDDTTEAIYQIIRGLGGTP